MIGHPKCKCFKCIRDSWPTGHNSGCNPNYPMSAIGANDNYAAVTNGSTLYILDRNNGNVHMERRLQSSPSSEPHSGPSLGADWAFVPTLNGQMEAYNLSNPKLPEWIYRTRGHILSVPVTTGQSAAWSTDIGRLIFSDVNNPEILFRLETNSNFAAGCAYLEPGQFFAATTGGYVYAIDESREAIRWESSTGKRIVQDPVATTDALYLTSSDGSLICLGIEDGSMKWTAPQVLRLVATTASRLYIFDSQNRFAVLDKETGKRIGRSLNLNANFYVPNKSSDRIYLASSTGTLTCLREMDATWPTIYNVPTPTTDTSDPAAPEEANEAADAAPADDTPTADDGSDPFDFGGGDDEPAADEGDDPFDFGGDDEPADSEPEEDPFDFE